MRVRTATRLMLIGVSLSTASCTRDLKITVSVRGSEVFLRFVKGFWFFQTEQRSVCVVGADAYNISGTLRVWSIRASNGACVEANELKVGSVPMGFNPNSSPHLTRGQSYYAVVVTDTAAGRSKAWKQP